jgi:hydrogenase maturation protein HypF
MADNQVETPVIGVAFDGTGYGNDGRLWGGEFFTGDFDGFKRVAHLEYLPLPGGVAAIKFPYRTAAGYLLKLLGENVFQQRLSLWDRLDQLDIDLVKVQVSRGFNSPLTSSMGRLFDAVAALAGVRDAITYEGQAAVELEMAADDGDSRCGGDTYLYSTRLEGGVRIICLGELLSAIIVELCQGVPVSRIAARFHNTIARRVVDTCEIVSQDTGIRQVALSGGVFQNRLLLGKTVKLLEGSGLNVLTHRQVPCNDGGISLGQAVLAAHRS